MKNKKWAKNSKFYIRMRDAKLRELNDVRPFMDGSLVTIARVCGNKNCKCAKGDKHESFYLTNKVKGKTQTTYIPRDLEEEIREWIQESRRIKKIMKEVSKLQRVIIKKKIQERKLQKKKLINNKDSI